jgi:hypothetical protein
MGKKGYNFASDFIRWNAPNIFWRRLAFSSSLTACHYLCFVYSRDSMAIFSTMTKLDVTFQQSRRSSSEIVRVSLFVF